MQLTGILNFQEETEVGIYLGIPLSHGPLRVAHFSNVQAKIARKLSLWKSRCLSLAGPLLTRLCCRCSSIPWLIVAFLPLYWNGLIIPLEDLFGITLPTSANGIT